MKRLMVAVALLAFGCGVPFSDPTRFDGDMTVGGVMTLWGQGNGTWTVVSEGDLTLKGMVTGDLVVDTGGRAEVFGTVVGSVVNNGGEVTIHGAVGGVEEHGGITVLVSGAVVGGSPVP